MRNCGEAELAEMEPYHARLPWNTAGISGISVISLVSVKDHQVFAEFGSPDAKPWYLIGIHEGSAYLNRSAYLVTDGQTHFMCRCAGSGSYFNYIGRLRLGYEIDDFAPDREQLVREAIMGATKFWMSDDEQSA